MIHLSKSKYCLFWQCPKQLWLDKYKPEARITDAATQARFDAGNDVGDLAMGLFGPYVEVTTKKPDGSLDLPAMIQRTEEELTAGTSAICEASFSYNWLYCAVDLLRKTEDGWAIYEVKSSTHPESQVYAADIAYQKYVLEHCGINVTGTYLVTINSGYVRGEELDLQSLFQITDLSATVAAEYVNVEANLKRAEVVLNSDIEPDIDLSEACNAPYNCGYWDYCTRGLPSPSVFDLYRLSFAKKIGYYRDGIVSFSDLQASAKIKNKTQLRQIDFVLNDRGTYTEVEKIREFLATLSYPLYFLDFETMQPAVPPYPGTKPYAQIPFQYSLHYIEVEGGELQHKEFLAESGPDPRRAIAEQLCNDIPEDVCVTAYNKSFECTRLKELASLFLDLSEHLLNIADHIVDLLVPFSSGYYYNRAMGGSFSIKSVLPAIFPDNSELDYHNLEGVHNGSEAMDVFPKIKDMTPEEQLSSRQNLLEYCKLDTYAMVKVWQELCRVAE